MTEIDYKKLKFKSGLEIHQQLDSAKKLFCNCPNVLRKDEGDYEVNRKLHAVAGESGEVDIAASHQASKDKDFVYQGYDSTCLVELDEEPPHEINKEALKIAVQIGLLMNMKIIPITQVMRKTVVDGSNTGGFQRTLLVARDGFIETESGKVVIDFLYLEEDAARIVSRGDKKDVYKLDRLGVPLVEVVTAPDVKNAEHAKEVALHIGNVLRSCKVKRGIGTIRQDVNISIRDENRVEIKGMQDMNIFIEAIEKEVSRQEELSDEGKATDMEVRNVLSDATTKYMRPLPGSARMYPETDLPLLKIHRDLINEAKRDLPKLKTDVEEDLKGKGLGEDMIKLLFKQDKLELLEELLKVVNKPELVAKMILMWPKEIAKHADKDLKEVSKLLEDNFGGVLVALDKGKISESDIKKVLGEIVSGKSLDEATKIEKVDIGGVEEFVMKIVKEKPGMNANAYMGLVMKEFGGKVSGKEVMGLIKKYL
jgi:Glu-tRNA(Gln) amidotransferase subunit E-like FAD-binding protein